MSTTKPEYKQEHKYGIRNFNRSNKRAVLNKLKPKQIQKLLRDGGRASDGGGLTLNVPKSRRGVGHWQYRYWVAGREVNVGLGSTTDVHVTQARERAAMLRVARADGHDPMQFWRERQLPAGKTAGAVPTFGEAAMRYHADKSPGWSESYRARWLPNAQRDCAAIWSMPVDAVDTSVVLSILNAGGLWVKRPAIANRARMTIEAVMNAVAALGHVDRHRRNPATWRGHLSNLLPKPSRTKRHHPSLDWRDLPAFMAELAGMPGVGAQALQFQILTAVRPSEASGARWDEVDLGARTWTISANRMKIRKEHRVPLSDAALAVLSVMADHRRNKFVFPSTLADQAIGSTAINQVLVAMGRSAGAA